MEETKYLGFQDLKEAPLDTVEVNIARLKGKVLMQELTGEQIMKIAKWSMEQVGDASVMNPIKSRSLQIALAMVEEKPKSDELKAGNIDAINNLQHLDQMLLSLALEFVTEGKLTDDKRNILRDESLNTTEKLEKLGETINPEAVISNAGELAQDVIKVGLRVPAALFGQIPISVIRQLSQQVDDERVLLAAEISNQLYIMQQIPLPQ